MIKHSAKFIVSIRLSVARLFVLAATIVLSSCVGTVEYAKTEDLFKSIGPARANGAFSKAKLALLTTENSALAFRHLAEIKSFGTGVPLFTLEPEIDPQFVANEFVRLLQSKFAEVLKVESADEARARASTVVMVLDLKVQIGKLSFQSNTIEVLARFISPGTGEVIDTLHAIGKSMVPYPAGTFNFAAAMRGVIADLDKKIEASTRLAAFVEGSPKAAGDLYAKTPDSPVAVELAFWESIKASKNPADFQAYLQQFPGGSFAKLARTHMSVLGEPAPARVPPLTVTSDKVQAFGNYHALVIGIDNYRSVSSLKTAVHDARTVAELLSKDYGFNVKLLIDATRNQMLDAFDELRRRLTEQDNLLIYYAGHGYLDVDSDRGYWLPVDADANRRANWLSNSDLADVVRATRAKHVLVVADSCYAGTLTRGASVQMTALDDLARLAQKRSRTALISGGLEPVEDAGGGDHSVFAKAFLDTLRTNSGVVDMSQMFSTMRRQVILGAQQTPQYGDIRQTGHEGGDFIFIRRR